MSPIDKHAPYGSLRRTNWSLQLEQGERIVEIQFNSGFIVKGIGFVIANSSGERTTEWYGGRAPNIDRIRLRANEYITKISRKYGDYADNDYTVIASLKIHTNSVPRGYGPFGQARNCINVSNFTSPVHGRGAIVGFHGRKGHFLEFIGLCVVRGR